MSRKEVHDVICLDSSDDETPAPARPTSKPQAVESAVQIKSLPPATIVEPKGNSTTAKNDNFVLPNSPELMA